MNALTEPPWLVTPEKVQAVVRRLIAVARPEKIILFGSYVRGELTPHSDLDVLVVTRDDVGARDAKACGCETPSATSGCPWASWWCRKAGFGRCAIRSA